MASATQLSRNDLSVLSAIFDPEGTPSEIPLSFGETTSAESVEHESIDQQVRQAIASVNCDKPSENDIRASLSALDDLIVTHPQHASAYNDRAQLRRMLRQFEDPHHAETSLKLIWLDLDRAIYLASRESASAKQSKVIAAAYTHRGHLLYRASKDPEFSELLLRVEGMHLHDREALEEMASKSFAVGGRYGNKMAKQMAVLTNPYAKLCGQMVKQALADENRLHVLT